MGKPRSVWPTFVSFPRAHAFQGNGLGLVYRYVSTTWDELSPKERERAMGFQTGTISHTKVIRLERNALLGRGVDLNSFTWLLVTCVLFLTRSQLLEGLKCESQTKNNGKAGSRSTLPGL